MNNLRIGLGAVLAALAAGCGGGGGGGNSGFEVPPQPKWATQQRVPTSSDLRSLVFADVNTGVIVGKDGSIFRTDDGGNTWLQEDFSPALSGDMVSLQGLNTTLVAVGADATNGGARYWSSVDGLRWATPATTSTPSPYTDVALSAFSGGPTPVVAYLLRANGTLDIVSQSGTPPSVSTGTWTSANSIWYIGFQGFGYVVGVNAGIGQINRTADGGGTWITATLPTGTAAPSVLRKINVSPNLVPLVCGDDSEGTPHGTVLIANSTSADVWTVLSGNPGGLPSLQSLYFPLSQDLGWVVGNGGTIYQISTSAGVTTWTAQVSGTTANLYGVYFVDNSNGWVVGDGGTILKTTNGGTTWTSLTRGVAGINLNAASFTDDGQMGIAVGNAAAGNAAQIFRTTDGGATWSPMTLPGSLTTQNLYGVSVPRTGSGTFAYVCGDGGTNLQNPNVWSTGSWSPVSGTNATDTYRAILFPLTESKGVCVGNSSGSTPVMLSTSNGTTWAPPTTPAPTQPTASYNALCANLSGSHVYASGSPNGGSAVVSLSSDLANGWKAWGDLSPVLSGTVTLSSISSPEGSAYTAFAAASDGKVYRLSAGGSPAWTAANVAWGSAHPVSLGFQGDQNGLVVTDAGTIFYTLVAGTGWTQSFPHTHDTPRAMWASPTVPGLAYVVCNNGTILKTLTLGQ